MVSDLKLAGRLIRGSGRAGLARLILMSFGYAFGAAILVFIAALPGVLTHRGETVADRLEVGTENRATFTVAHNDSSWRNQRFHRVYITGIRPGAPTAPGITQLPRPGEVWLSAAAADLAEDDDAFAATVPGTRLGTIGPSGLLGPDELYAYVGVLPDAVGSGTDARAWGPFPIDLETRDQFAAIPFQLLLIVTAPAILYFAVCANLSATVRRRRYASLSLLGMDRSRILRVAVAEASLPGVVGAIIGLAGYAVVNTLIGPSGILGFTWYSSASKLTGMQAIACVVAIAAGSATIGWLAARRAIGRPIENRFDPAERRPRWWQAVPLTLGLALLAQPILDANAPRPPMTVLSGSLVIAGVALSSIGLLLALRPVLVTLARMIAVRRVPLAVRIAARRVEHESAGLSRQLAGLCVLVLVAGIGAGVLRQTELSATPQSGPQSAHINGYDVPAAERPRILQMPVLARWSEQQNMRADDDTIVSLITAECSTIQLIAGRPLNCQEGQTYRVGTAGQQIPAGITARFATSNGKPATLTTPKQTIDLTGTPFIDGILVTQPNPPFGITEDTAITYVIDGHPRALDNFVTTLARIAPTATVNFDGLDLNALEAYRVHRGVIDVGLLLAFLLGIAAFLINAVIRSVDRRRDVTTLVVVGAPAATLRMVQLCQTLTPLLASLIIAAGVSHLAGNALLRLQAHQTGWYLGTLTAIGPMVLISLTAGAIVGCFVVGLRPRPEDLHRE